MAETELERAEKRYAQAKARLQALKNREASRQRKLDTRRKVILGGALLDLAERDSGATAMRDRLIRNLPREQDRNAFADWDVRSTTGEGAASAPATASEQPGAGDPRKGSGGGEPLAGRLGPREGGAGGPEDRS